MLYKALTNLNILLILHAELYKRDVLSVLNLRCPLPYNSSTKQAIKQAEALSLEVKEVEEVKFWNELLIPNLEKRHQARPVHSVSEMEKLKRQFPSNISNSMFIIMKLCSQAVLSLKQKQQLMYNILLGVQLNLKE